MLCLVQTDLNSFDLITEFTFWIGNIWVCIQIWQNILKCVGRKNLTDVHQRLYIEAISGMIAWWKQLEFDFIAKERRSKPKLCVASPRSLCFSNVLCSEDFFFPPKAGLLSSWNTWVSVLNVFSWGAWIALEPIKQTLLF